MLNQITPATIGRLTKAVAMGAVLSLAAAACYDAPLDEGTTNQASSSNAATRYMVQYHPGNGQAAQNAARGHGGDVVLDLSRHNAFAAYLPAAAANALSNNPAVKLVEVDPKRKLLAADPAQFTPWGISAVDADRDFGTGGAAIKVCIIDSGIDGAHTDHFNTVGALAIDGTNTARTRRRGAGGGELAWNEDDCGHGTHVAGTIAAADNTIGVVGVVPFAPGAVSLHIVRVFEGETCDWTFASSLVKALDHCTDANVDLVNMSLGGGGASSTEEAAFDAALAAGVLSIAASGNEHPDGADVNAMDALSYPASYDSVMSVAAVDEGGGIASFSTRNSEVDIAGPGVDVVSTVPMDMGSEATLFDTADPAAEIATVSGMDGSATGGHTGALVDCNDGQADCVNPDAFTDFVCLTERGTISFADKANRCFASGGKAIIVWNNLANSPTGDEIVQGTYAGEATLLGVGSSRNDGLDMQANRLGDAVTVNLVSSNYSSYNGTSMATPHVVGVAALLWSHNATCSPGEIRNILTSNAAPLAYPATHVGTGLVQASDAAVTATAACDGGTPPPPPPTTCPEVPCGDGEVCNNGTCEPDGGGGLVCPPNKDDPEVDRPPGCHCDDDLQCYFGKCKGKRGSQTCN